VQDRARAEEILATHEVDPLPSDVVAEMDEVIETARRELAGV
jgi:hypothetical protein